VKGLPLNFVYEHPSIATLTRYLVEVVAGRTCSGDGTDAISDTASKLKQMEDLVAKYTANFPARPTKRYKTTVPVPAGQVVVLTGSTGSLGSQILASLVEDAGVARVYALNRRGVMTVQERQAAMWEDHGLDPRLLASDKIRFVDVDASEGFAIAEDIVDEVSCVVNIPLASLLIVYMNNSDTGVGDNDHP